MARTVNIEKKTHAYILPDGTVVRAIAEAHVSEYQKDKKTVYAAAATKTVAGEKIDSTNYYVSIADYVKRSPIRTSVKSKLESIDVDAMSAAELKAAIKKLQG